MKDSGLHSLYVQHLLSNGSPVRTVGGSLITFQHHNMQGSGWFSDKFSSLKSGLKNAWSAVKPVILEKGRDLIHDAKNIATNAVKQGAMHALSSEGSIRDRIKAGAQLAKNMATHDVKDLYNEEKDLLQKQLLSQFQ